MDFDYKTDSLWLMKGDCLERMKEIQSGSVDAIICDPPFGTVACKWDVVIPLEPMWNELKRIIKPTGAIVLFGSQPFTSVLITSNLKMFKYELVWDKCSGGAFVLAKKRILPSHENILLFSFRNIYNPQMDVKPIKDRRPPRPVVECKNQIIKTSSNLRKPDVNYDESKKYPTSVLYYPKQMQECNNTLRLHPTQKPVALLEYLIKTYSNERDTILDFTMGSGSTGIAALNTNRKFIGIEKDDKYYDVAKERILNHKPNINLDKVFQ